MRVLRHAFKQKGFNLEKESEVHHEGLNMFEELCWVNTFIEHGSYKPNWGARYFAELVNPIPRTLWPGKPMAGIDYAIARGQKTRGNEGHQGDAGVDATISTGLIGQGEVNFGRFFGPAAAADTDEFLGGHPGAAGFAHHETGTPSPICSWIDFDL